MAAGFWIVGWDSGGFVNGGAVDLIEGGFQALLRVIY
jgi:hypothetical protein